jgi:hypothetical protein
MAAIAQSDLSAVKSKIEAGSTLASGQKGQAYGLLFALSQVLFQNNVSNVCQKYNGQQLAAKEDAVATANLLATAFVYQLSGPEL